MAKMTDGADQENVTTPSDTIVLFDVDGTLTKPRLSIEPPMMTTLKKLRQKVNIGVVGGSDLPKQKEQLGPTTLQMFDYNFAENGVVAYEDSEWKSSTWKQFVMHEMRRKSDCIAEDAM